MLALFYNIVFGIVRCIVGMCFYT